MTPLQTFTSASLDSWTQLLHRFFLDLDERRYDGMLDAFTDDCRWLRQGQWLEGKAAVRRALESRDPAVETRHVLTNTCLRSGEADRVELSSYMTAYRYPATPSGDAPVQVANPLRFNLVETVLRHEPAAGWRIAEQRLVTAFGFEA